MDKTILGSKAATSFSNTQHPLPITFFFGCVSPSRTGAVLLPTLILLLTINMVGATLTSLFSSVTTTAEIELSRAQALYLAEAGIAQAIHQLRQAAQTGGAAQTRLLPAQLGEGTYSAYHDFATGTITATGEYRGVRRSLQLKYKVF